MCANSECSPLQSVYTSFYSRFRLACLEERTMERLLSASNFPEIYQVDSPWFLLRDLQSSPTERLFWREKHMPDASPVSRGDRTDDQHCAHTFLFTTTPTSEERGLLLLVPVPNSFKNKSEEDPSSQPSSQPGRNVHELKVVSEINRVRMTKQNPLLPFPNQP